MSDAPTRVNSLDLQCRIYNADLRYTNSGKAVCNARTKLSKERDGEWYSVWFDVTMWDDGATVLAECDKGDEVILRGARIEVNPFPNRDGEMQVVPCFTGDKVERLGPVAASKQGGTNVPTSTVPDDSDIPF